jgi:hypothetical protein
MAAKKQMDQGSAVTLRQRSRERGVSRARKAAEDLSSAAGATGDKGDKYRQQAIRPRELDEGGLHRARGWFRDRFTFPSLGMSL